jgi:hypothetical protein
MQRATVQSTITDTTILSLSMRTDTSLIRFVQGRSAKVKSVQNSARLSNQGGLKQQQQQQFSRYSAKSEVSLRNSSICIPEHSETKDQSCDDEEQQQQSGRKHDDSLMRLKDADSASRRAL